MLKKEELGSLGWSVSARTIQSDHRSHLAVAESVRDDPFDLFSGASVPTVFEFRISAVLPRHGLREDAKG
ncbi:unnamed protein product [Brassica oleracea]